MISGIRFDQQQFGLSVFADLDGDGFDDLVVTGAYYPVEGTKPVDRAGYVAFGSVAGFAAAPASRFPASTMLDVHAREFALADFNGDGVNDLFIADHGYDAPPFPGHQNHLYLSQSVAGTTSWIDAKSALPQLSDFTHSVAVGDVNGDGYLDIFAGNLGLHSAYFLLGGGHGSFNQTTALLPIGPGQALATTPPAFTASLITDLDGDGWSELVLGTGWASRDHQVFWSDHGTYATGAITALPAPTDFGTDWWVMDVQSVDVNFDGRPDLLVAYQAHVWNGGWRLQVLINQGDRQFSDQTTHYLPDAAAVTSGVPNAASPAAWIQFLRPYDLNGDGRMDFVVDGSAWGGKILPANFPIALMHQADGTFDTITVGQLREQGMPDFMFWGPQFVARGTAGGGEFVHGPFYDAAGVPTLNVMPVTFAPAATQWLAGTQGADHLVGSSAAEHIAGFGGNDAIDAGAGIDMAYYSARWADATLSKTTGGWSATSALDGTDTLSGIERLRFADYNVALDIDGNAGQAYRLYQAAFDRVPDLGGLGYQMNALDTGGSLVWVASNFIASPEFNNTYGALDNVGFVTLLYRNVLNRDPDQGGLNDHIRELEAGLPRNYKLVHFSESPENQVNVIGAIENGMVYLQ